MVGVTLLPSVTTRLSGIIAADRSRGSVPLRISRNRNHSERQADGQEPRYKSSFSHIITPIHLIRGLWISP